MYANAQEQAIEDLEPVQGEGQNLRDYLVLQLQRMDTQLSDPNLTPDERYAIAGRLLFWIE